MTELEVTLTRSKNRWTLKIDDTEAFSLTAHFRAEEPGAIAFERTGWRAVACASRILKMDAVPMIKFIGLSPHPDAQ
jgi:hypothetical protein